MLEPHAVRYGYLLTVLSAISDGFDTWSVEVSTSIAIRAESSLNLKVIYLVITETINLVCDVWTVYDPLIMLYG